MYHNSRNNSIISPVQHAFNQYLAHNASCLCFSDWFWAVHKISGWSLYFFFFSSWVIILYHVIDLSIRYWWYLCTSKKFRSKKFYEVQMPLGTLLRILLSPHKWCVSYVFGKHMGCRETSPQLSWANSLEDFDAQDQRHEWSWHFTGAQNTFEMCLQLVDEGMKDGSMNSTIWIFSGVGGFTHNFHEL